MKTLSLWQVDSFTKEPFKGNPAAVVITKFPLPEELMQNIAIEMNLSETAFVELKAENNPYLRWFTPTCEIDLCGHATLAAAHIMFSENITQNNQIVFETKYAGQLSVSKYDEGLTMNFPSREGTPVSIQEIPGFVLNALSSHQPIGAYQSRDLMLVYDNDKIIQDMVPDFNALLDHKDYIIVTARSSNPRYDFISRFFCADDGIAEDPVTGSAHCTLAPYWAKTLNKNKLTAFQASKRGGELQLELTKNRLFIHGQAVTVLKGNMMIEN